MSGGGHGGGHGKRRGHEEEHEEHENHERWLVSYADMMTLLMVLFIVMFAISQVDSKKFMALKTGLAAGFGAPVAMLSGADNLLDVGGSVAPDTLNLAGSTGNQTHSADVNPASAINPEQVAQLASALQKASVSGQLKSLKAAEQALKAALAKAGIKDAATFRYNERGLVVTIATDKVLFNSGNATLEPGGRRILDTLAPTLRSLPNMLSIDGHTNSIPIHTAAFPSNWELSTARATNVLQYLISHDHIDPSRLSATGHADTEPLLPSSNPSSVTVNRRVEIVVLASFDNSAGRALATLGNSSTNTSSSTSP